MVCGTPHLFWFNGRFIRVGGTSASVSLQEARLTQLEPAVLEEEEEEERTDETQSDEATSDKDDDFKHAFSSGSDVDQSD